ncbi:MAG: hypothetical protein Q8P57_01065 [Candidatus Pacearchaeota archaeon]|nr:hypothetical protein [Candidatus Pacearchaeota archaeon]
MLIVKDAMVMIHLAKITLLESSCKYFNNVLIPNKVYAEIMAGKELGYVDVNIIEEMIMQHKIKVKKIGNQKYLSKTTQFNIQGGEAESVALYWQEKANFLATDDDNVRRKNLLLNLKLLGTPAIILLLYKKRLINKNKFKDSLEELRKIGWFSSAVIDKVLIEGEK